MVLSKYEYPATEKIRRKALELPLDLRASLAHDLISSLDDADNRDLTPEYEQEIQRRLKKVLAGHANSRPAKDVFKDIKAKMV